MIRQCTVGLIAICTVCATATAQDSVTVIDGRTYDTSPTRNSYLRQRSNVTGRITAIDLAARRLTLQSTIIQYIGTSPKEEPTVVELEPNCKLFIDYEPHDLSELRVGQSVQGWWVNPDATADEAKTVASLYLLKGTKINHKWFPEFILKPDKNGCLFFDDFESGDFTKWQYQVGCVSVLDKGAIAGKHSFTASRPKQTGGAHDHLYVYGLPHMNDIWMQWKFRHTGEPADTQAYAIFRPFPASGAQLFAVRILTPERMGEGQWRLACQLAEAPAPVGNINLEPGKTYTIKLHWKMATAQDAADGTVETWINGVKDIDQVGNARTWTKHKLARLSMGILHTGSKHFGATIFIDDVWFGDRDPGGTAEPKPAGKLQGPPQPTPTQSAPAASSELPEAAETLTLWDGESPTRKFFNARSVDEQAHRGKACMEVKRARHSYPEVMVQKTDVAAYDELWFYAKATREGETLKVYIMGPPETHRKVAIEPYIEGGKLTTEYKLVRIPLDDLYVQPDGKRVVEIIAFGIGEAPVEPHTVYIDDISVVRVKR